MRETKPKFHSEGESPFCTTHSSPQLLELKHPVSAIFCDLEHIKYIKIHCPVAAKAFSAKKAKRDWMGLLAQGKEINANS